MTEQEKAMQQDIIDKTADSVTERLKKEGSFATRDELHSELMDAMKNVTITPQIGANGEFTPKQIGEAKAAWYRQVIGKGLPWEAKAWTTDVSGAASELVPSLVANAIVEKLNNTHFRKVVTQYPYSAKGTINAELVQPVAYRMTARGTAVTEAAGTLNPITYATNGLMAWMGLDNKLIREATPQTIPFIENAFVRAIARQEEKEWTLGVTAGATFEMTGMTGAADGVNMVSGHLTVAAIDATDVLALYWALEGMYADNAVLLAPNATLAKIASLNTTTVTYLNTDTMKFLGGHDVIRMPSTSFATPATTKPAAYFGDMSYYYLFADGPITIATTDQGKTALTTDNTYIAAKVYTDGKLILGEAVKALKYLT